MRVSTQDDSSFVIVTDRNFCQTFALVPAKNASGLTGFSIVQETGGGNQILSTGATPPVGATDSPGDFFNLIGAGCEEPGGCVVVNGAGGVAAATLFDVNVVNRNEADVVIYHVRGLTDCGLRPLTCVTLLDEDPDFDLAAACPGLPASPTRAEAIACLTDPDVNALRRVAGASPGSTRPEVFERNYTPFLPDDITDNFDASGTPPSGIPPLWFRPDLRGRLINQGNLGLLFFVTEAREADVLTIDFEVSQLQGGTIIRDCESFANGGLPPGYTVDAEPGGAARGTERLLDGDIPHRTSERYDSFVTGEHIGTNILAGCGSTRGRAGGVSGFLYDAEYTPCPGTLDAGGNLVFDAQGSCTVGEPLAPGATWTSLQAAESEDDAVFAKAYVRYLIELRQHLEIKLCTPSTPSADDAVLSQADCSTLRDNWINLQDKSQKAILAVIQPKQSGGAQNFGAVNSQLSNYQSNLLGADRSGPNRPADLSNEYGQQVARVETLIFLLENRLEPSVSANGFSESDLKWTDIEFSLP